MNKNILCHFFESDTIDNDGTINDKVDGDCNCVGEIPSPVYECPLLMKDKGDSCDDNNDGTINDKVDGDCNCKGTPPPLPCSGNGGDADGDGVCVDIDCDDSPKTGANCSTDCQTFYRDADEDTFGSKTDSVMTCVAPTGYVANNQDCDDNNPNINPISLEIPYNEIDENCDGEIYEGPICTIEDPLDLPFIADMIANPDPCYIDLRQSYIEEFPIFIITNRNTCGNLITEIDYLVFDCRGNLICASGLVEPSNECRNRISNEGEILYTFPDTICPTVYQPVCANGNNFPNACEAEKAGYFDYIEGPCQLDDLDKDGFTVEQGDCDDMDSDINPDAVEIPCNGIDEDCDGSDLTTNCPEDIDGDGFTGEQGDCDDNNPAIYPGAAEIPCNGIDENCNGMDDSITGNPCDSTYCIDFEAYVGQPCDDNDPNTENEWLEEGCKCVGQVINGCNAVIIVRDNMIIVEAVNGVHIKVHLYDRTFSNAIDTNCDFWNDCEGTQTFDNLLPGVYAVQYQSFNADWNKVICDSLVYVEIEGTADANDCSAIDFQVTGSNLAIDNLPTLNTIIDVFDPSFRSMFNCIGDCGTSQTVRDLPAGDYWVRVKVYDVNWNYVCEREEATVINGANLIPTPPNPEKGQLTIYPNPAKDFIQLGLSEYIGKEGKVAIYNTLGKLVYEQDFDELNIATKEIDIRTYDYGLHVVTVQSNSFTQTKKFIHLK